MTAALTTLPSYGQCPRSTGWIPEDKGYESPCWIWHGYKVKEGYGVASIRGRKQVAHRAVYEHYVGDIPEGLTLDHLCRQRDCVNPAHLEPISLRENVLRGTSFAAIHAAKTHCPQGHPYDEQNTVYERNGTARRCRICSRDTKRRHEAGRAR